MNPSQAVSLWEPNLVDRNVANLVGQNVFDIFSSSVNNKKGLTLSHKKHKPGSKNLEFFGSLSQKATVESHNIDSSRINLSLPQLRSGCIQSPLHKPIKLESFVDMRRSLENHFSADVGNRPKFSPVQFIKGRGVETVGLQSVSSQRDDTASLSLKNLSKNQKNSPTQLNDVISVLKEDSHSAINQSETNQISLGLQDRFPKKSIFSNSRSSSSRSVPVRVTPISYFNRALKKQCISPSFKADFLKQLNMEWNYEKLEWLYVNDFLKTKQTSFKGDQFKGFRQDSTKVKPLSSEMFKSRVFGMRWKNPYQISVKSRVDNLYSGGNNKEKTTSIDSSSINPNVNVHSMSSGSNPGPNIKNNNLNLLFNKRILWIPNQFFQLIRMTYSRQDKLSLNHFGNLCPKEAPLFFSKPPLFLQTNRQGHLKAFTSFINFPSLLNTFNSYKGKSSDLESDFNSIINKTLSDNIFTRYNEYSINQSFGLIQNWYYCHQKSNVFTANIQNTPLSLRDPKNHKILFSSDFPIKKKFGSSSSYKKKYKKKYDLSQMVNNFITFCTLCVFNEKKLKQKWSADLKKENSVCSPSNFSENPSGNLVNKLSESLNTYKSNYTLSGSEILNLESINSQKVDLGKQSRALSGIPNSIKRQLNKLNCITYKDQLSLYLLSLNFKSPFITTSSSRSVLQTNHNEESAVTKSGGQTSILDAQSFSKLQFLSPNRGEGSTDLKPSIFTDKDSLMTGTSFMSHFNLKKGWVYFGNNPLKMLSYHKTIIYPGQINDFS